MLLGIMHATPHLPNLH